MEQMDFFGGPALKCPTNQSQAMSALVKNVKLRRTDDAVYWLLHFTKFFPGQLYRQSRRLLIIAGEDNVNVPVQMYAADWFSKALAIKDPKKWCQSAASLIHLICATDDWWKDPIGSYQICIQRRAHREYFDWSEADRKFWANFELLKDALAEGAVVSFFRATRALHESFYKMENGAEARRDYVQWLADVARKRGNLSARLSAAVHLRHWKALGGDNNYIAQAEHKLFFGLHMGGHEFPTIKPEAVHESVEKARGRLCNPEKAPSWTQDGVHTGGSDRRFAGLMPNMLAVCNMYREYGRLDPADEQKLDHFSTTKLFQRLVQEVPALAEKGLN